MFANISSEKISFLNYRTNNKEHFEKISKYKKYSQSFLFCKKNRKKKLFAKFFDKIVKIVNEQKKTDKKKFEINHSVERIVDYLS